MPLFMMTSSDPTVMYGLAAVHYLAIAVTMISYIAVCRMVIRPLTQDIRQILKNVVIATSNGDRLRGVVWKFERIITEITNQAVVQTILAGLFGLFPYMQRMASCKYLRALSRTSIEELTSLPKTNSHSLGPSPLR